jgi:hypothetical protein
MEARSDSEPAPRTIAMVAPRSLEVRRIAPT